jgi:uncharacterized damage-inducible protein DinB
MSEANPTLALMTQGWDAYQRLLAEALEPLTLEQSTLRAAPDLRSIDELARHIIRVRAGWFHFALGVGDAEFAAYRDRNNPDGPPQTGRELAAGLRATWEVMRQALAGFTPEQLQETVERERDGKMYTFTRGWVVWHVIEHDLHHGGELGYSLGMHGLSAPDI